MSNDRNQQAEDALECVKCGQSVDQILALQCEHNLCLLCASKQVQQQRTSEKTDSIKCEICEVVTILDPESSQILREMKQEMLGQSQMSVQRSPEYQQQLFQSHNQSQSYQQTFQPLKDIRSQSQTNQNQQSFSYLQDRRTIYCRDHPQEEAILFCFTCETPCLCVECCLNGLHKGHDLKNIMKNYGQLEPNLEELRFRIKTRADILLSDESRLTQKKREMVELVNQARGQIQQNFQELMQLLEAKQRELIQSTEELMEEQFSEIDKCLDKVKHNLGVLGDFDRNLEESFYGACGVPENQIRAYNYYADHKLKMIQVVNEMDQKLFYQVQEKMKFDFSMDMSSLYQHLDSVKGLKFEIMCLRGLELTSPNRLEAKSFESARKEWQKRQKSISSNLISQQHHERASRAQNYEPRSELEIDRSRYLRETPISLQKEENNISFNYENPASTAKAGQGNTNYQNNHHQNSNYQNSNHPATSYSGRGNQMGEDFFKRETNKLNEFVPANENSYLDASHSKNSPNLRELRKMIREKENHDQENVRAQISTKQRIQLLRDQLKNK